MGERVWARLPRLEGFAAHRDAFIGRNSRSNFTHPSFDAKQTLKFLFLLINR